MRTLYFCANFINGRWKMKYLCCLLFYFLPACEHDAPVQLKPLSRESGKSAINAAANSVSFAGAAMLWSKADSNSAPHENAHGGQLSSQDNQEGQGTVNEQGKVMQYDEPSSLPKERPGDILARPLSR